MNVSPHVLSLLIVIDRLFVISALSYGCFRMSRIPLYCDSLLNRGAFQLGRATSFDLCGGQEEILWISHLKCVLAVTPACINIWMFVVLVMTLA